MPGRSERGGYGGHVGAPMKEGCMAAKTRGRKARTQTPTPDRMEQVMRGAINGAEIVSVGVLNLVRQTLVTTLSGLAEIGGHVGGAGVTAVRMAIHAVADIGGDLGGAAKGAVQGTVQAAQEIGGELGTAAKTAAQAAVRTAGEVGGDVADVARRVVEGTIAAARTVGGDAGKLGTDAAAGAIQGADRLGAAAGRAVRDALAGTIAGVKMNVDAVARPAASRSGRKQAARRVPRKSDGSRGQNRRPRRRAG